MEKNEYPSPISIKQVFGSADIIAGDRVIFNIKGNSYRIIVNGKIFHTNYVYQVYRNACRVQ
jgi:mRNA-degrading endonuclease HigB of HigAB toxin-antitoxin module